MVAPKPRQRFKVRKGVFLVAAPSLLDPNFRRTVVLLCEHSSKGSMGLIVNRPTTKALAEVLPEATGPSGSSASLFLGGPVGTQGVMVLHRFRRPIRGSTRIIEGVNLGGEQAFIKKALGRKLGPDERVRVYLGYAGWDAKQLDRELAAGGWIVCPADAGIVFDIDPTEVWSEALWSMGGIYRLLSAIPPEPSLN